MKSTMTASATIITNTTEMINQVSQFFSSLPIFSVEEDADGMILSGFWVVPPTEGAVVLGEDVRMVVDVVDGLDVMEIEDDGFSKEK